ncbi:MAG: hypothetical protein HYZ36_07520 [Pedosphaera parvula]|nr:hypothetical protein [Pedosphaera parvula]
MKLLAILLGSWLVAAITWGSPVEVEVVTDQNQFLPDESLEVGVRISNLSGQTLHLGKDDNWVSFFVEAQDRRTMVRELGQLPAKGEFAVETSTRVTRRFDLAPYYSINQPGRYRITATVRIQKWNEELTSSPKEVNIVGGTTLWEQEFGVPKAPGAPAGPPEVRKYILQQARLIDELRLYLRITDLHDAKIYRVAPVDRLLSFSTPEVQIDRQANLHVLHQTGRSVFNYSVFDPDGRLIIRQQHTYDSAGGRARLRADAEGRIVVSGGLRRPSPLDVPQRSIVPTLPSPQQSAPPEPEKLKK